MSAMGKTFEEIKSLQVRLGISQLGMKTANETTFLPKIGIHDAEDPRYMTKGQLRAQLRMQQTSKTNLNIMNVTFNSRPGVKQYIESVVGRKASPVRSQLPVQGMRQYRHNGYNNFYFSSQKRGTVQRFNLLNPEMKTQV